MRNSVVFAALVLLPMSFAHAQIPTIERDALIALYNSTDGPTGRTPPIGYQGIF